MINTLRMKGRLQTYTHLLFFVITILLGCTHSGYAQIVNVESARMQSDTTGWKGNLGAAFSVIKNTQQIVQLDVNAHVQYKTTKDLYLLLGNYTFLKGAGQELVNNTFFHFRYNRKINDMLRWEVFTQTQSNVVTGIQSRFLIGTGPRFKITANKVFRLYAATLIMYEQEKEVAADAQLKKDLRNSSYVSFSYTPAGNIELVSTSFYQPLLRNFKDFRLLNQETLKISATKNLAFIINWNYLYDSYPAVNTPETNYTFSTGFNYAF